MREENGRFFCPDMSRRKFDEAVTKAGYNAAEPRNNRSRWTRNGDNSDAKISDAAYRGHFHDLVVDDFLQGWKGAGRQC